MSIEKVLKDSNKKYGAIMTRGSLTRKRQRFPSGSLSLDLELGGGVPTGCIVVVAGEYSDGKTSIVLKMVGEYQREFPEKDVVWIDAEGAWDDEWSRKLGVDPDKVFLVFPEYTQQAYDVAEQCIEEDVGLLVIDSVAALVPKEEAEASMEDWQVGLAARINNKFVRKMHSAFNDKRKTNMDVPPTAILINQLRSGIGTYAAQTEPGGKGIGFAASVKIMTRKGDYYPYNKAANFDPNAPEPKAQQIKFFIEKNKTAPPKKRGHVWFYFDTLDQDRPAGCYDRIEEIVRYCKKFGVCVRNKSYFDVPNMETGELVPCHGATAFATFVRENPKSRTWVENALAEAMKNAGSKQEVEQPEGDDEAEGDESSEEDWSEETAGVGSNSMG